MDPLQNTIDRHVLATQITAGVFWGSIVLTIIGACVDEPGYWGTGLALATAACILNRYCNDRAQKLHDGKSQRVLDAKTQAEDEEFNAMMAPLISQLQKDMAEENAKMAAARAARAELVEEREEDL